MELAKRNLLVEIPTGMRRHLRWDKMVPSRTLIFCIPPGLGVAGTPDMGDFIRSIYEFEKHFNYEIQSLEVKYIPEFSPAKPVIIVCDVIELNTWPCGSHCNAMTATLFLLFLTNLKKCVIIILTYVNNICERRIRLCRFRQHVHAHFPIPLLLSLRRPGWEKPSSS